MSLSELCVRRPVFATMLVTSLVVLGIFSFRDLGVDLFPKADPATVSVSIQLPGASPDEIVTSAVEPLEDALSSISGIDQMTAQANEGAANITVRFVLDRDLNDAANSVREKVSGAMRYLPPQVLPPVVQKADPDADPVMTFVLSSDTMSLRTLTEIADKQVKRNLESVDGVGQVTLSGGRAREIHVVVDVEKLNSYGLTVDQVRDAIQKENVDVPGGTLEQGKSELSLRTLGRIEATDQFKNIIITTVDTTPIRISDVGYAEDATERTTSAMFLDNGKPAVQIDLRRASGENTIKVTEAVKAKLKSIEQALPKGATLTLISDDSRFIYASVASLEEHLLWGSLLAALVVMFFIRNVRAVLISAMAIPASIVATFTLMRVMDFTLNNMTLLGLTLAVGIVIDDAIVVLENIFRYIEEKNCTPFEAAIQGTREVTLAVMATTLSLVVIFMPVAFMTGYARRFIYPFGLTMAFAILVSMFVSFTLTPMLSSRFLKLSDAVGDNKTKESRFFRSLDTRYTRSVEWSLAHPLAILGASVLVFAMTFPLNRLVGRTFIPNEDMGQLTVHLDTPEGTSVEGTSEVAKQLAGEISGVEGISHIQYLAGAQRLNHAHLFIFLLPPNERKVTQDEVVTRLRKILAAHPSNLPIITARNPLGGGEQGNFPIQASLLGPDMARLNDYALQMLAKGQGVPSLADPKTSVSNSSPEIRVAVDRGRAADLGVRMSTIGTTLRLMVSGDDEISTYREGIEQYPVKMRVLESQRRDVETIGKLTVASSTGRPVRIDSLARMERGFGPTQLRRNNRQFSVDFQSDVAPGHALDEASADVRRLIAGLNLPPGYSARLAGQTQILDETTTNLIMAIALASIFVYIVLGAQFESFVQPIVIMVVLPLSVPFALLTLWATGRTLNLWSALGVLLLLGIVKKNAILQVDYANVLRARGVPLHEAIVEACRTRLRPILMTTSAIIAGLVPTALGIGIGGAQRSAIAVTIIGGQTLCLFLTLLVVPVAYVKFDALEQTVASRRAKEWMKRLAAETVGRLRPAAAAK
ncbi:MAG TPA: efflux RND transporter permease subunit [Vicinamibacterales bacterium]|jgi:HAE1 family hydrophobic/amphiphilic exporter-1|nr:efflux RND transporter permease subunit [Vicinamibacterales bacterium]